jgi:hypothetical protein
VKPMGNDISQKKVEEYSSKINKLIEDARYSLTIPMKEVYTDDEIKNVNESWKQALSKIKEAQRLIEELLKLIGANAI